MLSYPCVPKIVPKVKIIVVNRGVTETRTIQRFGFAGIDYSTVIGKKRYKNNLNLYYLHHVNSGIRELFSTNNNVDNVILAPEMTGSLLEDDERDSLVKEEGLIRSHFTYSIISCTRFLLVNIILK